MNIIIESGNFIWYLFWLLGISNNNLPISLSVVHYVFRLLFIYKYINSFITNPLQIHLKLEDNSRIRFKKIKVFTYIKVSSWYK